MPLVPYSIVRDHRKPKAAAACHSQLVEQIHKKKLTETIWGQMSPSYQADVSKAYKATYRVEPFPTKVKTRAAAGKEKTKDGTALPRRRRR